MAITKPTQTLTLSIKEEITSRDTHLMRIVQKNEQTGFYESQFPIRIFAESITYELDAEGNRIDIYDRRDLGSFDLTAEDIGALWMEPITLQDGTVTVLGELLATKLDQVIGQRVNQ